MVRKHPSIENVRYQGLAPYLDPVTKNTVFLAYVRVEEVEGAYIQRYFQLNIRLYTYN